MKKISFLMSLALALIAVPVMAQTIDGDWSITDGEYAGEKVPQTALDSMRLKVNRNQFDAKSGDTMSKGMITNQSRSRPPQLVFKIDSGADAGREIKAIYEMNGATLKIAFSQNDEFPSGFESDEDNKFLVLTYKNNKPVVTRRGRGRGKSLPTLPEPEIHGSGGGRLGGK